MRKLALCLVILLSVAIAADRGLAGKYAGDWKSNSGDGGAIRFTLDGPHGEAWKCDLMFVLSGTDVKTTMREVKVQETKIDLLYDFDAAGNTLRSHVTGEWDGASFKGKYETTVTGSTIDSGTWTAVREKKE